MNYCSDNNVQNNWSMLYKEINNNNNDYFGLKLKKQPKQISLLTRSLVRYIINVAVVSDKNTEFGVIVNKSDNNEYLAKKNKTIFIVKPEKSDSIIKPIFSKQNYILLESKSGALKNFQISNNHIKSINEYLLHLYKHVESNNYLIGKLKFLVNEKLACDLYNLMFLANKKNNEKLYSLHKLINKVFEFSINVKNAAYLPSYRRVQWESLEKTLNKIGTIINSLSEYNKFKIAFIIECLLNSNKFKTANIDNQIVFLKFLSELKNKFLSACSIFENTKTILENLENQDIANTIKFENIKNNENDFYNQLTNIKNKFTYDKQESVNIQIFPVCVLNNKNVDGQIQCVESTISNISNDNINNIYKDSCISQISNI